MTWPAAGAGMGDPGAPLDDTFRTWVEHHPDGVLLLDGAGVVRYANRSAARLLGTAAAALVGVRVRAQARDGGPFWAALAAHIAGPADACAPAFQVPAGAASPRWLEASVARLHGPRAGAAVVTVRDVTDRERVHAAQRDSELRLQGVLNHAFGYIAIVSLDGLLVDINQTALAVAGVARADAIGRPFCETPWWNRSASVQDALNAGIAAAAQGQTVRDETVYFAADGTELVGDRSFVPLRDAAGRVRYVLVEGRDITERKRLEEALREREDRLRRIFRLSPAALCISRLADGLIVEVNDAFLHIFGYTREDVIGRTTLDLQLWQNRAQRAELQRLLQERGAIREVAVPLRDRAGDVHEVVLSSETIDLAGEAHVLTAALDVTERKRLLLLEERERIAADLHDSTIQSISSAVLTLGAARRLLPLEAAEVRAALSAGIDRLNETIAGIRHVIFDLAVTRLGERGLRAGLEALAADLGGAGIEATVTVPEGVERALPSEAVGTLLMIAREAVMNVIRHAHARAATIRVEVAAPHLVATITDDGRGFDVAAALSGGGRGLHNISERARHLGGRSTVTSAPGGGAAVRVEVPIRRA